MLISLQFALAKPVRCPQPRRRPPIDLSQLTYSRGSFIPLNLAIQCTDPEALNLLQSPLAVSIILLQSISTGKHAHVEKPKISREIHVYPIARAVCWQPTTAGPWNDCRVLMGEIALPKKIPPSTVSPRVVIKVRGFFGNGSGSESSISILS